MCIRSLKVHPTLVFEIKEIQETDKYLQTYFDKCKKGETTEFHIRYNGIMCYKGRICVPNTLELREKILKEADRSKYFVHPGNIKIYHNFYEHYWLNNMKNDVASFVSKCLACHQGKTKHQRPVGTLQSLSIPEWK